jgi:uncharacterized protein (TIGR03083 family)
VAEQTAGGNAAPGERTGAWTPVLTAQLYPRIEHLLIELLSELSPTDWNRPTLAPQWKVRDVAAHLLDTQLRRLSIARDGHVIDGPRLASPGDLVSFINRLNREGVALYRRLSRSLLISLMKVTSHECAEYHQSLDPFGRASFAVTWAGQAESQNWFDTAREYTERWHHQEQIRLAVGRPGIMTRELYHPVLGTFMRALPHHYRGVERATGCVLRVSVAGDCGGDWHLRREPSAWRPLVTVSEEPAAQVTIPQEIAWQLFTKGIDRQAAAQQMIFGGDSDLARHVLSMLTIVA